MEPKLEKSYTWTQPPKAAVVARVSAPPPHAFLSHSSSVPPKKAETQELAIEDDAEIRELMLSRRKRLVGDTVQVSGAPAAPREQSPPIGPASSESSEPTSRCSKQNEVQSFWSEFADDDGNASEDDDDGTEMFTSAPPDGGSIFWR
jgi:hypothetical protein